jgi:carboxylesterase type B
MLITMMMSPILAIAPILAMGAPTVNLGYSKYQGNALQYVDEFLGMRYAAQPTGNYRWRAPGTPVTTSEIQNAVAVSYSCRRGLITQLIN